MFFQIRCQDLYLIKMKSIFPFFLLLLVGNANAQLDSVSLRKIYEKDVIYFYGSGYIKNDVKYPYKSFKQEFNFSKEGQLIYLSARADMKSQVILASIGLTGFISAIVAANNKNKELSNGLFIGSLIPYALSIKFAIRRDKKTQKAVWLRNRDVLLNN